MTWLHQGLRRPRDRLRALPSRRNRGVGPAGRAAFERRASRWRAISIPDRRRGRIAVGSSATACHGRPSRSVHPPPRGVRADDGPRKASDHRCRRHRRRRGHALHARREDERGVARRGGFAALAILDAGLSARDIDGICGEYLVPAHNVQTALGIEEVCWYESPPFPPTSQIVAAMHAIFAGALRETVVCYHAAYRSSGTSRAAAADPICGPSRAPA